MVNNSQLHNSRPDDVCADLLGEALDLCQLQFELHNFQQQNISLQKQTSQKQSSLKQQIATWREQSVRHELAWQQAQEIWMASARAAQQPVKRGLLFHFELSWERLRDRCANALSVESFSPYVAAALSVLLVSGIYIMWPEPNQNATSANQQMVASKIVYDTAPREQKTFALLDGSTAVLNWNSRISVEVDENQRRVVLEKGEVHFSVASDKTRPFTVHAAGVRATAVGTQFMVRNFDDAPAVVVNEGRVEVSIVDAGSVVLEQNQRVAMVDGQLSSVTKINSAAAVAWRQGMLVFENMPLVELLDELARYTSFDIEVGVLTEQQRPVSANYFIDRADQGLKLLAEACDLRIEPAGRGTVRVSSKPPEKPSY